MDVQTGLVILGGAIGSAKVVEKILGPTSDYVGNGLKEWTEKRVQKLGQIFKNTEKKLGSKIDEAGEVNPKVLKGILSEGSFCDDELGVEYFGGVLASSRTNISRDDRGAVFVNLVSRLTAYQIRTHYIFYLAIKNKFNGKKENSVFVGEGRAALRCAIPFESYKKSMDFTESELRDFSDILQNTMFGLVKESLIESSFMFGSDTPKITKYIEHGGIVFTPSALGVELFHWVHGKSNVSISDFLDENIMFQIDYELPAIVGTISVSEVDNKIELKQKAARELHARIKPEF
jgi:hypothetical protein